MSWTVAGVTEEEFAEGSFWATLGFLPGSQPVVLSISELLEPIDYDMCSARFGVHFQFFVLNPDAVRACEASGIKLRVLGSIEFQELKQPCFALGYAPRRAA
jgi:hypothetical protein